MKIVSVNEETNCIEVIETLNFEETVLPVIKELQEQLNEKLSSEDKDDLTNFEIESANLFIKTEEFNKRQIAVCLQFIVDAFDEECNYPVYEPSVFDKDIIRKGVEQFIEEEFEYTF